MQAPENSKAHVLPCLYLSGHSCGFVYQGMRDNSYIQSKHIWLVWFQARGGSANSEVTQTCVFLLKKEPVITWNIQIPAQRYQFTLCKHFLDIIHTEKTLCQSFVTGWLCITELLFSCYVMSVLDSKAHATYFTVHAFSVMPTLAVAVSGETADLTQGAHKKQAHGWFVRAAYYDL